ncbi:MAG: hypothetical protein ACTSRZ_20365 [Promethearchaeota archaeon]
MSIYKKIKFGGLIKIVWKSAPNIFAFPYGLYEYRKILKKSSTLEEVFKLHSKKYFDSGLFRLGRPKYHKIKKILLEEYDIE